MYRILIVEDDSTIASNVAAHLERWDYETKQIEDFKCVMEAFQQFDPQLVILDIGLPFYNGFYWCQEIRKISSVPILFLSSMNDNMNIVMAMNMGGDEFIEKPFDLNVLTAKVQALLRRAYSFQGNVNVLEHEGMLLNLNDASLSYKGEKISLTKNEFRILQMLMENAGKIVARDDIIARLWESDEFIDDNTLTVNVARLRKKLENADMEGRIKTKKGIGYYLEYYFIYMIFLLMRLSMDANCLLCGVQYVCLLIFTNIINGISYYISTGSSFLTMQNNSQSIWILLNMIIRNLQRNYIRQSRSLFLRIELQKKSCLIIMACGFIRSKHRLLHWIFYCKIRSNFYMKKI